MRAMILALGAAWAVASTAWAADAEFKDWWAACDNTRGCTAFGFTEDANFDAYAYLKLTRGAGRNDAPMVEVVGQLEGATWRLQLDDKPVAGVPPLKKNDDRIVLSEAQSAALAAAIANGSKLEVIAGGEKASISLAGSSAALRWLDDQQKRVGTITALVAKGPKPVDAVPDPPSLPVIRVAAPVAQGGLPSALPEGVKALMTDCDEDAAARMDSGTIIARLGPGVVLYAPLCNMGAYNFVHIFITADEKGRNAKILDIRYADGSASDGMLMNVDFDPETQILNNFEKGRGPGDCGSGNAWAWTGKAFVQTDQALMSVCKGVMSDDWPTVFRSGRE